MAAKVYTVNSNETRKIWSRRLFREALKQTWLFRFMGTGDGAVIQIKDDGIREAGDRVRCTLRMQLTGEGISGDDTLEGNEEALTTFTDDVLIDQLRHAVRSGGRMTEQRVLFDMREEARLGLTDWWADKIDEWGFNQLAGMSSVTDLRKTGLNAAIAPSTDHQVFPDNDSEASVTAAETFQLDLFDKALEKAKTNTVPIRPIRMGGTDWYVAFLHPFQVFDMRRDTNTNEWMDIQKAAMQGGRVMDNPIFTGALGVYNGVIIHESTRVPIVAGGGAGSQNLGRALFCGAQAGLAVFSSRNSPTRMTWDEELFDYGNQLGVSAGMIAGVKKSRFNSLDFGTVVMSTTAIAH